MRYWKEEGIRENSFEFFCYIESYKMVGGGMGWIVIKFNGL